MMATAVVTFEDPELDFDVRIPALSRAHNLMRVYAIDELDFLRELHGPYIRLGVT